MCAVCLDPFEGGQQLRMLPCLHRFHKECIDSWLFRNPLCPLCKADIRNCVHRPTNVMQALSLLPEPQNALPSVLDAGQHVPGEEVQNQAPQNTQIYGATGINMARNVMQVLSFLPEPQGGMPDAPQNQSESEMQIQASQNPQDDGASGMDVGVTVHMGGPRI